MVLTYVLVLVQLYWHFFYLPGLMLIVSPPFSYSSVTEDYQIPLGGDYGVQQEQLAAMSKEHDMSLLQQLGGVSLHHLLFVHELVEANHHKVFLGWCKKLQRQCLKKLSHPLC